MAEAGIELVRVRSKRNSELWFLLAERSKSLLISLSTCGSFSALLSVLPALNFPSSWASLPPASHCYVSLPIQSRTLSPLTVLALSAGPV